MANPLQAIDASAQKLGAPAHKSFFYKALLWYTSWFYWAAGVYIGLVLGTFYGIKTYLGTLLTDAFKLFGKKPPTAVAKLATSKPGPSTVAAAVTAKPPAALVAPVVKDTAARAATTVQTATSQARVAATQAASTVSTKAAEAGKATAASLQSFPPQSSRAA